MNETAQAGQAGLPVLSVVVMAFNEAGTLEAFVCEMQAVLTDVGQAYELIIVDDGSSDGSRVLADQLGRQLAHVRVIHHETNLGLGGVYRTGFARAQGQYVTFFPADGQFPAAIIQRFLPHMEQADMVLGYLPERGGAWLARLLSGIERLLYRSLFGRLPRFQGVLMFRRSLLGELELKSTGRGWAVLMELIIRASRAGCRLVSLPTEVRPRQSGQSKVNNLPTMWANLKQVVELRRHLR